MILRGTIQNGGLTYGRSGRELMLRISLDEATDIPWNAERPTYLEPGSLRGLGVLVVVHPVQPPVAVKPDGDDAETVAHGDDALTVAETSNG